MDVQYRDPWTETWRRRVVTIPLFFLVGGLLIALSPLIVVISLLYGPFEKHRFAKLRFMGFMTGYFGGEMLFLTLAALQWLALGGFTRAGRTRVADATVRLSNWWGQVLYSLGVFFFDLRINIGPAIARREAAFSTRLLPQPRYAKLNAGALLRMDLAGRYEAYGAGINSRFLAPSEARSLEDLPPFTPDQLAEFALLFPNKATAPTTGGTP